MNRINIVSCIFYLCVQLFLRPLTVLIISLPSIRRKQSHFGSRQLQSARVQCAYLMLFVPLVDGGVNGQWNVIRHFNSWYSSGDNHLQLEWRR